MRILGCVALTLLATLAGCTSDSAGPAATVAPLASVSVPPADRRSGPDEASQTCIASVRASNALLERAVLGLFPAGALRRIEKLKPADTLNCDPDEGPDFGGVTAQWDGIDGVEAIKVLAAAGWNRRDPATGPPQWETRNLPHGDGQLNVEPGDEDLLEFAANREGKDIIIGLTQDGLRAAID